MAGGVGDAIIEIMREKIEAASYVVAGWIVSVVVYWLVGKMAVLIFVVPTAIVAGLLFAKKTKRYSRKGHISMVFVGFIVMLIASLMMQGAVWAGAGYGLSVIVIGTTVHLMLFATLQLVKLFEQGSSLRMIGRSFIGSPLAVFAVFAVTVGITLAVITPVFVVNDESSHYFRADQLASGQLISSHDNTIGFGGKTQRVALEIEQYITNRYLTDKKGDFSRYITDIKAARTTTVNDRREMVFAGFNNTALYSPIPYIVSTASILASKLAGNSIFATIVFGRLANLAAYILLTALAIYIIPSKKWLLAMVALLPMSLQQAASFSGDSLTLSLIFLGIAVTSKLIFTKQNEGNTKKLLIAAGVLAVLIGLTKQGFAPFSMLAFGALFVPHLKAHRKHILIILTAAIIGVMTWYGVVKINNIESGQVLALRTIGIELRTPNEATANVAHHPLWLVRDIVHTFILQPQPGSTSHNIPDYIFTTFTGRFETFFIAMPVWYAVLVVLLLLGSYYRIHKTDLILSRAIETQKPVFINKIVVFAVGIGSFAITLTAMYLYATNRTANFINGFQGRYLLPVAALFAFIPHSPKRLVEFSKHNSLPTVFTASLVVVYSAMISSIIYICYLS